MKIAAAAAEASGRAHELVAVDADPARPRLGRAMEPGFARLGITAATIVAFGLRMYGIGELGDLDFDEQASFFIGSMPPPEMLRYLLGAPFEHPPFFYLLFHVWLSLAGGSETAMRVFPVLPGTLTVPLVGVLAARIAGPRAGVVAAWVLAVAPLHVYYSRDARMYSLLGLLTVLMVAGVTWRRAPARRAVSTDGQLPASLVHWPLAAGPDGFSTLLGTAPWLIAATAAAAALTTHYYATFVVIGVIVGLAWAHRLAPGALPSGAVSGAGWQRWWTIVVGTAGAILAAGLVWLATASGFRTSLTAVYPRAVDPAALLAAIVGSLAAPLVTPLAPPDWLPAAALVTIAVVAASLRSGGREMGAPRRITLAAFLAPTLGVPLLLLLGRPFAPRFVALVTPLLPVLVGVAACPLSRRWLAATGIVALPLAMLMLAPLYGGYTRGDYGRAMAALRAEARPDDAVVLNGPWQELLYRRYGAGLPERSIIASTVPLESGEAERNLAAIAAVHPRVWVVDAATDIADPTGVVARWLDRHAYARPVIAFQNALLRPYLTDVGRAAWRERPIGATALEIELTTIGVDAWQLPPGGESRVRVAAARPACSADDTSCGSAPVAASGDATLRLSLRLVSPDDRTLWHWDGQLTPVDNGLEYRAGLVIPPEAVAGSYPLRALVYEAIPDGHGGRQITRMAPPLDVGAIEVVRSR